uniref:POU domain protein n=1 Tax=Plectus sambesii TaxID=2011161 RepID=A0A914UMV6_9BILA
MLANSLVRRQSSSSGQGLSPASHADKHDAITIHDIDSSDGTSLRLEAEERTCEDLIREKQEKQRQMLHLPKGRLSCNGNLADDNQNIDGINLEEIKEFAKSFKLKRLSMGLTQTQVGQALSLTEGPAYSQSAICRFEKLDITPKSAQKIKPVLEKWMTEIDEKMLAGHIAPGLNGQCALPPCMLPSMLGAAASAAAVAAAAAASVAGVGSAVSTSLPSVAGMPSMAMPVFDSQSILGLEIGKKRKRRTSFTPQALEVLNRFFERNTHPTGAEMTALAESLNYEREVVRVWFCNKRQALKNTIKKLKHVDMVTARHQHHDLVKQQQPQQLQHVIQLPHDDNHH